MNREHLELCGSTEWRQVLSRHIRLAVLAGGVLGDDGLEIGPAQE